MNKTNILSCETADLSLLEYLRGNESSVHSEIGRIHSVFNHVINIITADNIFFSIGSNNVIQAPNMIRLSTDILFSDESFFLKPSIPIKIKGEVLLLNDRLSINLSHAKIWNRSISGCFEQAQASYVSNINEIIMRKGKAGGLKYGWVALNRNLTAHPPSIFEKALLKRVNQLEAAIVNGDVTELLTCSKQLVGVGIGLTPSGDDFLVGWLSTWQAMSHPLVSLFLQHKEEWLQSIQKQTTDVSYYMLKFALEGRVNDALTDLLVQLDGRTAANNLLVFCEKVLSIGSSSGTDMLAGVAFALKYCNEN